MTNSRAPRRPDPVLALLWVGGALLVCALIGFAVYEAWPVLYPQTAERAPLNPDCDLGLAPCTVAFDSGGSVSLDIQPRGIPPITPLQLTVQLDGVRQPRRVEIDFTGHDMDMGYNRVPLHPTAEAGRYQGSGMLPVRVRARMTWDANVLIYQPDGIMAAPYRFDTVRGARDGG